LISFPAHSYTDVNADLNEAVYAAAQKDIRVVFGDRDFLKIFGRAWEKLSCFHKVYVLIELIICSILPRSLINYMLVEKMTDEAGGCVSIEASQSEVDALSALLRHMGHRYPSLAELEIEQIHYAISSLERLDIPLKQLCPSLPPKEMHRRGKVLVVTGIKSASCIARWLSDGHVIANGAEARRAISRTTTSITPTFILALVLAVLLVMLPIMCVVLSAHNRFYNYFLNSSMS
jgi:pheromone shutdown protein TraB